MNQITIFDRLNDYLRLRDFTLEYSDDRLALIGMIDQDHLMMDYMSSQHFRKKQIKLKQSPLSEHDPVCNKLDNLAYFILKSKFKNEIHKNNFISDLTGSILNNMKENNLAYTKDYKIKEADRVYGYPIMSVYAMKRNRSDNVHSGKNKVRETFIVDELRSRYHKYHHITEGEAYDLLEEKTDKDLHTDLHFRMISALVDPKNVLLYFRHEREALAEVEDDPASEITLVSYILEDISQELHFKEKEYYLLDLLKDGFTYEEIKNKLNEKYDLNTTTRSIKYRFKKISILISEQIRCKINIILS